MTAAEYARHRKIAKPTLSQMLDEGKLKGAARRVKGRWQINEKKADALLKQRLDPSKRKKKDPGEAQDHDEAEKKEVVKTAGTEKLTYSEAQTLNMQYQAALRKLDYEMRTGKLISMDEVRKDVFEVARATRDAVMNIPDRIAAILAAEKDQGKVREILNAEIRQALEGVAKSGLCG